MVEPSSNSTTIDFRLSRDPLAADADAAALALAASEGNFPEEGHSALAPMLREFWKVEEAWRLAEQQVERQLLALPAGPVLPVELMEPFVHPTKPGIASPGRTGWTADQLRGMAQPRGARCTSAPWIYWDSADASWRKRAAELLRVREDFDLAFRQHELIIEQICELSGLQWDRMGDLVSVILKTPATSLPEVIEKIRAVRSWEGWDFYDYSEQSEALFDELLSLTIPPG